MAQGSIDINIVLAQPEQAALASFVSREIRPVVLRIDLQKRCAAGSIAKLGSSGKQAIRLLEIKPSGINLIVILQVLIIQIDRQRSFVESPRTSSAQTDRGEVHSQLIDVAVIFRLQRQHRRKRLPILQRGASGSQIDTAEHKRGVTAARRSVYPVRGIGIQHMHTVYVGLGFVAATSPHQQFPGFALHLRARQYLQRFVQVTVGASHRNQIHRSHIAPAAVGYRCPAAFHHHLVQTYTVEIQLEIYGIKYRFLRCGRL